MWCLKKVVLVALPLYQCPTLLAPHTIMNQISMNVWKFLWQGGRSNERKYHLINWKMVRNPKDKGGLGIKDPIMMNVAMGEKLFVEDDH
jgi:hypothetical protein